MLARRFHEGTCQLCGVQKLPTVFLSSEEAHTRGYLRLSCAGCRQKERSRIHSNNTGKRMRRKGRKGKKGRVHYVDWMQLLVAHNFSCRSCGKKGRQELTLDHIRSIDSGGMNTIDNIQVLCRTCHSVKDNSKPSRYRWLKDSYRRFRFWLKLTLGVTLPYPLFFKGK